jgi:hypothetical protein
VVPGIEDIKIALAIEGDTSGHVEGNGFVLGGDIAQCPDQFDLDSRFFPPLSLFPIVDIADAIDRLGTLPKSGTGQE